MNKTLQTRTDFPELNASLRLRVVFDDGVRVGPGKADLLGLIAEHGSIAAAGRAMKMSYKRAWMLVEEMNAAFKEPLVESSRGGSQGGGAHLTSTGREVLAAYRGMEQRLSAEASKELTFLSGLRVDVSGGK
ncbi:MAG: LysR family transcriptional regulator [Rhodobacteraceae bacterium]|nr:LysR family transcriptional regulator [Paracoccaceae bacterium]